MKIHILIVLSFLNSFCAIAQKSNRIVKRKMINFIYDHSKVSLISCIPNKGTQWENKVVDAFINYHADFPRFKEQEFDPIIINKWMSSAQAFYAPSTANALKIYRISIDKYSKLVPFINIKSIDNYLYFVLLHSNVRLFSTTTTLLHQNLNFVIPFTTFTQPSGNNMFVSSNPEFLEKNCVLDFCYSAIGFSFRRDIGINSHFSSLDSLDDSFGNQPYYSVSVYKNRYLTTRNSAIPLDKKFIPYCVRRDIKSSQTEHYIRNAYFHLEIDERKDSLFDPSMIPIQLIHLQEKKQGVGKYFTINHRLSIVFDEQGKFYHATRGPMMPTVMKEDANLQNLLIGDTNTMVYRYLPDGENKPVTKKLNKEAYDQFEELFDSISEATAQSALNAKPGQKEPVLFSPAWLEKYATRVDISHFDK